MSDPDSVLTYLERLPGYPFDLEVDADFVDELLLDFPGIDILEQVKTFRWHHGGRPDRHFKSIRPALRRWLASALRHESQPF